MIRLKRRNTSWLVALGLLIGFAFIAVPAIPAATQIALLGILAVAMAASMIEIGRDRENLIEALRRAPIRQRISPQAKEATERAKSRGGYMSNNLTMLDLGVIASQSGYEGMAMRRTRSISKDDDGVRPFVTLHVDPEEAERSTVIRFEIYNQNGEQEYIHEMRPYLREGELTIMADYHLPLAGNSDIQGVGDWDMRVYIDGNLAGLHNFTLAPSFAERAERLSGHAASQQNRAERYANYNVVEEEPQVKLQDLLGNGQDSAGQSNARRSTSSHRRRR